MNNSRTKFAAPRLLAVICGLGTLSMQHADAAVTLSFDSTSDGFGSVSWNLANGSPSWSPNYGGSLRLQTNLSGWTNPVAILNMTSTPALQTEYQNALAYGGSVTFDFIVSQADIAGYSATTPPGWFELFAVANTDGSVGGGYDQNVLGGAPGFYGGVPAGPTTKSITLGIVNSAPVVNNNVLNYVPGSGWNELMFGLNSEIGTFTGATVYIDNLTITANPAPEPSSTVFLGAVALAGLSRRRRSRSAK
jgi:hypothetical protein